MSEDTPPPALPLSQPPLSSDDEKAASAMTAAAAVAKSRATSEEPSSSGGVSGGSSGDQHGDMRLQQQNVPNSNRNSNSLKQFTQRFRSFSNDLLRSIESAHDMVDLSNSNFATATHLAAAQHFLAPLYLATSPSFGPSATKEGEEEGKGPVTTPSSPLTPQHDLNSTELGLSDVREEEEPPTAATTTQETVEDETTTKSDSPKRKKSRSVSRENHSISGDENVNALSDKESREMRTRASPPPKLPSPRRSIPTMTSTSAAGSNRVSAIDEINTALTEDQSGRVIYRKPAVDQQQQQQSSGPNTPTHHHHHHRPLTSTMAASAALAAAAATMLPSPGAIKSVAPSKSPKDQVDFRIKKRHILKNGIKIAIPDDIRISILEVFIYLWGVITFFADLISDIILSIEYYKSSRTWLGSLTLTFVIVPNVTLSLFSLSWYIDKYYSEKKIKEQQEEQNLKQNGGAGAGTGATTTNTSQIVTSTCDSITFWITAIFFVVFQLDLVWKYIQGFVYTLKGWAWGSLFKNLKWEKYYIKKQIKCDTDIGMLRLIDVFLDSGPQVLLQLYVITTQNLNEIGSANLVYLTFKDFQTTSVELKQLISILSSLFSMGYALAGYHRCLRNQQFIFCLETNQPLPRPMSWPSTIFQFLWYLCLIAPRVLSMAIFASTFRSWFFMIIFTHWLIMYFWILSLKTNYCITSQEVYNAREEIFEKFYNFVCSFIYIFVYFNLKAGPTRLRYLIYYMVFYAENILFCSCYFMFSKETNFDYKLTMLLIVVLGFWLAIAFQVIYYLYWHPSHKISVCVTSKNNKFQFIYTERLKPKSKTKWSSDGPPSSRPSLTGVNGGPTTKDPALSESLIELKRSSFNGPDQVKVSLIPNYSQLEASASLASFSSLASSYRANNHLDSSLVSLDSNLLRPPLVNLTDLINDDDDDDEYYDNLTRRSYRETSL